MAKTKTTTVTTDVSYSLKLSELREALKLPPHAKLSVSVPGGGDWSNCDLELDDRDCFLDVAYSDTETKTEEV